VDPFFGIFFVLKKSRGAPGWNLSKNVSANNRGAANFAGLSKLGGWGLSPIFGNFSKTCQNKGLRKFSFF
jgi:hypothetical protein